MASLECRNNSWRVIFYYKNEKKAFAIGEVSSTDAHVYKASTEELLRLLKRNLVSIPSGCSIEDFMYHRGKPPEHVAFVAAERKELTLEELWDAYFKAQEKKLEATNIRGMAQHFRHLCRIMGGKTVLSTMTRADLQRYVDRRAEEWIDPNRYRRARREKAALAKPKRKYVRKNAPPRPPEPEDKPLRHPSAATIMKEIISLRTTWNWARRQLGLIEEFPGVNLDYEKIEEGLPYMTWDEALARIEAGDEPDKVWEAVYLRPNETAEMLEWVKGRPVSPWVYPMIVFAAYTGARRSEIVRALPSDIDLVGDIATIREKKKDKRKLTTRRVPISPFLKVVLTEWMATRAKGKTLFCKMDGTPIQPREAHNYFERGLRLSKWSVLKGWHVCRHSFAAALASAGVDQRVIDELMGHSTEQQRRRYRHLFPDVTKKAINDVFG